MRPVVVLLVCIPLGGCASFLAGQAGGRAGTELATAVPTPPARVIVEHQGGNWCDTQEALGYPWYPDDAQIDTTPREFLLRYEAVMTQGIAECGW